MFQQSLPMDCFVISVLQTVDGLDHWQLSLLRLACALGAEKTVIYEDY